MEAQGLNRYAFNGGDFVDGIRIKAFVPRKPVYYQVPPEYPLNGSGTISIWLNADDWDTDERRKLYRYADYTRWMRPFEGR